MYWKLTKEVMGEVGYQEKNTGFWNQLDMDFQLDRPYGEVVQGETESQLRYLLGG